MFLLFASGWPGSAVILYLTDETFDAKLAKVPLTFLLAYRPEIQYCREFVQLAIRPFKSG
jgi:hypothetical protein